jgi:hypothetical protein
MELNIFDLVRTNSVTQVATTLANNPVLVHATDGDGNTLLHIAAAYGNTPVVELLIAHGADVNAVNEAEETPLFDIFPYRSEQIAQLIIDAGGNIHHQTDLLRTPLSAAIHRANLVLVRLFIQAGADPNAIVHDIDEQTPLLLALDEGRYEIAVLLLQHTTNIHQVDYQDRNALHYAALRGYSDIVSVLIERGITKTQKDMNGKTAYQLARERLSAFQQITSALSS